MPVSFKHRKAQASSSAKSKRRFTRPGISSGIPRSLTYQRAGQRAMMAPIQNRMHEIKFVDNATTATNFRLDTIPPTGIYLGGPVQGAAPYQRIGQRIANKSLRVRGIIHNVATTVAQMGRIVIAYDEQANGAVAAWSDVISSYTAAGANASLVYDGVNMNNRERFKILCDEQFWLPSVTNSSGVLTNVGQLDTTGNKKAAPWNFDRFIPLNNLVTHFKASAGGVGDVATGALIMFVVCDSTVSGVDASYAFVWSARLRYDDL